MSYQHTQRSLLPLVVATPAVVVALLIGFRVAAGEPTETPAEALLVVVLVLVIAGVVAALFSTLSVRQEGPELVVHFGPLPWIRRRIPFREIEAFRAGRSSLLDGWGIHWRVGHGWIWNVWGRDCVELELSGGRRFRIGTDDPTGLVQLLEQRLRPSAR